MIWVVLATKKMTSNYLACGPVHDCGESHLAMSLDLRHDSLAPVEPLAVLQQNLPSLCLTADLSVAPL